MGKQAELQACRQSVPDGVGQAIQFHGHLAKRGGVETT